VKVSGLGEADDWFNGRLLYDICSLQTADCSRRHFGLKRGAPVSLNITQIGLNSAQINSLFSVSSR